MCGPNLKKIGEKPAEEQYLEGKRLFEEGDYTNSVIVLDRVARLNIISKFADSTQYYLAESHFMAKSYILAQSEYERLIRNMQGSPLVKHAMFKIGLCYFNLSPVAALDQEYSAKAQRAFRDFADSYPLDEDYSEQVNGYLTELKEKNAEKLYHNGDLYRKMGDYESALIYLNMVLVEHYDTKAAPKSLFKKAECYDRMEKYEEAKEALQIFLENFPDHEFLPKVNEKMTKIRAALAKADTTRVPY